MVLRGRGLAFTEPEGARATTACADREDRHRAAPRARVGDLLVGLTDPHSRLGKLQPHARAADAAACELVPPVSARDRHVGRRAHAVSTCPDDRASARFRRKRETHTQGTRPGRAGRRSGRFAGHPSHERWPEVSRTRKPPSGGTRSSGSWLYAIASLSGAIGLRPTTSSARPLNSAAP